jgi:predicted Fe-Mo cluster-binding NifX family protein
VAVTSTGNSLDSLVSSVFGRCPYFIVADIENGEIKDDLAIENPAKNDPRAGNKTAEFMANRDVKSLISGAVGPNAFNILKDQKIKVYKLKPGSVRDNLKFFIDNKLDEITTPSSGGPGAAGKGPGAGMGQRR